MTNPDPFEAPVLVRLKTSLNTRWPGRDHSSDGWIGDTAHQGTSSDHNPAPPTNIVRARDIDKDGIHVPSVLASLLLHPSTRYAIFNEKIYHVDNQFRPKKYTGKNKHTKHLHESIEHTTAAANSKSPWIFISTIPKWPTLRKGMSGTNPRQLQALLNGHGFSLALDGQLGDGTDSALRSFQKRHGLKVDGLCGPKTYLALRTR